MRRKSLRNIKCGRAVNCRMQTNLSRGSFFTSQTECMTVKLTRSLVLSNLSKIIRIPEGLGHYISGGDCRIQTWVFRILHLINESNYTRGKKRCAMCKNETEHRQASPVFILALQNMRLLFLEKRPDYQASL